MGNNIMCGQRNTLSSYEVVNYHNMADEPIKLPKFFVNGNIQQINSHGYSVFECREFRKTFQKMGFDEMFKAYDTFIKTKKEFNYCKSNNLTSKNVEIEYLQSIEAKKPFDNYLSRNNISWKDIMGDE